MAPGVKVLADLDFEVEMPGRTTAHGTVRSRGAFLELEIDRPEVFAGRADQPAVRALAEMLAAHGLVVRVVSAGSHLITLGVRRAPWWQRRATGSRHIRLGGLRGAWTSGRARLRPGDDPVLPDSGLFPPLTPWPIAPTLRRGPRAPLTTTHDPARGGAPHLVLVAQAGYLPDERQPVHWLRGEVTTIGSGEACDIRLDGLQELHAEVVHDAQDEYVVVAHHPETRVHGARVHEQQILRTGTQLMVGGWRLVYSRAEYADHGRPYGGRIGGELGHQRPQPPRSQLQGESPEEP